MARDAAFATVLVPRLLRAESDRDGVSRFHSSRPHCAENVPHGLDEMAFRTSSETIFALTLSGCLFGYDSPSTSSHKVHDPDSSSPVRDIRWLNFMGFM